MTWGFDIERFTARGFGGHGGRLGIRAHAHGPGWVELALPWHADLVGDEAAGVLAAGPIVTLMDMATSLSVWMTRGAFVPHATLDLRVDTLRAGRPGATVIGRGECTGATGAIAFVRGLAHDGDPADPIAQVAGTFMLTGAAA